MLDVETVMGWRFDPVAFTQAYAQAGAPEGALYVDGQFVGWIRGVQRL